MIAKRRTSADPFFDSNLVIYALVDDDERSETVEKLLARGGVISVQVLNEVTAVARRKLGMSWADVGTAVAAIRTLCAPVVALTADTHDTARRIGEKYGVGIYDALIAAAALEAGCTVLYSEDFQDGQVIDGGLTVRNPFKA